MKVKREGIIEEDNKIEEIKGQSQNSESNNKMK